MEKRRLDKVIAIIPSMEISLVKNIIKKGASNAKIKYDYQYN